MSGLPEALHLEEPAESGWQLPSHSQLQQYAVGSMASTVA
jgi:hypothetical protein